jgi:hypothetical protein
MSLVRIYDASNQFYANSTWTDATSFFVYSSVATGGQFSGTAWLGSVASPDLVETDIPSYHAENGTEPRGLSNGHGAVAFQTGHATDSSCDGFECPKFRVWTDGSLSDEHDGEPVAWSLAGDRLAVIRSDDAATTANLSNDLRAAGVMFNAGWLEVLSYPSLKPIYSNGDLVVNDIDMEFSPSGQYLLVETQNQSTNYDVVNLDSQTLTPAPYDWPTNWYGNDEIVTRVGRDLVAHGLDGTVIQRWKNAGDGPVAASPDGRLIVTTDRFRTPKFVDVIRDGQMSSFALPDVVGIDGVDLVMPTPANDGRSTGLMTERPDNFGPLLILQVPE